MYKDKFIVFLDLLGFRNIIKETEDDIELAKSIYEVLSSFTSGSVDIESFATINREVVKDDEYEEVMRTLTKNSKHIMKNHNILFTHFSDSLVISCDIENESSCFIIFELLGKLNYRLWNEHNLLIRGGLTIGKLIHEDGGPLFGPAIIRAYDLESKVACYPRILIDEIVAKSMVSSLMYEPMMDLFEEAGNNMFEINLATSLSFFLQSHYSLHPRMREKYVNTFKECPLKLDKIIETITEEKVKVKYDWLVKKVKQTYDSIPIHAKIIS